MRLLLERLKEFASSVVSLLLSQRKKTEGDPFLEVHHIKWLARKGNDTLDNAVALCPNCHRRMHHLDDITDKKKLIDLKEKYRLLHPELYGSE